MTDYKEQYNDRLFSSKIHKLLADSGYKCETTASDADGYSHLIFFKNEAQFGGIHTDKGKIVWIEASEVGVEPEVMPKFMETIEEWEETMKMHIDDAIDKQEQQISEHYYKGREDAAKYAIEMIHKHLKLNKLSA